MKTKSSVSLLILVFLATIGIFSSAQAKSGEKIVLRFASFSPAGHKSFQPAADWCKEVEKRSNGRVNIEIYPAGTLAAANWMYNAVLEGVADIGHLAFPYFPGVFPLTEVLALPLGSPSALVSAKMYNAWYQHFKPKEMEQLKVLFMSAVGPFAIHSKKAVRNLEDMRGLKIRTSPITAAVISTLGGTPVSLPATEAYDALQKGVVNGVYIAMEAAYSWRYADVTKYSTVCSGVANGTALAYVMSKAKWDTIPADLQKVIDEINEKWGEVQGKFMTNMDEEAKNYILKRGNEIITMSKEENARWKEKVEPVLHGYVEKMNKLGLPGAEALKFCQDYIENVSK